ncbi:hypothetical protein GCM10009775_23900 [Microbacterium aoyamense]|uniref:Periplasmic binding protein domain-containing protein n=1 Tax=Microbacterium aoyamense TaxID=344166 RepID=A0ABP5B4S9_9MICO|nr:sugar ABC transporter substrate-binding protein [Microbacterium aoyamense]
MKKSLAAIAIGAGLVLALTACGSTTDTPSGGGTDAPAGDVPQAIVDMAAAAAEPQTYDGPTTSPDITTDVTVVSIPCSMAAAGCARWDAGVHAAADVLGWDVQTIDPAFDPTKTNDAFQQAINMGADAVVMISIDPALVSNSIAAARQAGIVVVSAGAGYEDDPYTDDGIQYDVSAHGPEQGEWIGAVACNALGGAGNVMTFIDEQFKLVQQRMAGVDKSLAECPGITTKQEQISAADLGTVLQGKVAAMLQANPDVNAVIVPADAFTTDFLVALQQIGRNDVSVYSMDANENIVENVADGGAVKGTIGVALEWQGWATLDNVNRLLADGTTTENHDGVQIRLVSEAFIPEGNQYTGDSDFEAIYTELWTTGAYSG